MSSFSKEAVQLVGEFLFVFFLYVGSLTVIGFAVMGLDKQKARTGRWRTPEKTLWLIALLGGSIGVFAGMRYFRHKTKHASFSVGLPLLIVVQLMILAYIFYDTRS
ncbi:DUF1294 domain-containing protein [Halalkalibacterium halodurans]|uniref:DUF1294 domain-containing protein n=1 Tax=Halalkalibacterium halodurans TaxID=86665 RepID=UPI0002E37E0C|nr:DUF1294 domain-containing protein [Halalkalibacterium halodurans]MDY7223670.1 DUF1294 domain-containing protein [Halalkalibacterium halodurans]MDY7242891.1 DUF1294 domain-containing protein [Halalkalibacterium halodurans]MED3645662.1 DUF1294 domain-containing protein [Halalkalibacterium halodurans]MED4082119.1 DUF1294 domain-containing protein [Halalkalibacterium halodurans]MED4084303.1 DUF1294 domain-containing protein [Halalkalibacterium halodurans]